ncbi:hypothetical protein Q97_03119 [Enterococcus faecalis EnGen0061]|nr:hypothetical protein Q97_03119 [Enterococcus faecalis EnGen0061]
MAFLLLHNYTDFIIREPNKTIINTSDLISTFDKFRNKQLSSYQLEEILERIIRN